MEKLTKVEQQELKKQNKITQHQEKKIAKYMNNLIKYNVVLKYHLSTDKLDFSKKCAKMFKDKNTKTNIKLICNELYLIFKDMEKNRNKYTQNKNYKKNKKISKRISKKIKYLNKLMLSMNNKTKKKLKGGEVAGPYLQRLTTKGDQPITGDDMAKVFEEITTLLDDVQYLDDAPNVKGFNALLKYFNGDQEGLKSHLRYAIAPQFYSTFPLSINIGKIYERWDNIVDILNAYKNDRKIKLQFAVDKGLKPEDVLKPTFLDKFADRLDSLDQKFQKAKRTRRGSFTI